MKIIFLIEKINFFNFLIAIIFKFFFVKTIFFKRNPIFKKKIFNKILEFLKFEEINFGKIKKNIEPTIVDGDILNLKLKNNNLISPNRNKLTKIKNFFKNISDLEDKIFYCLFEQHNRNFYNEIRIAYWLNNSKYKNFFFISYLNNSNRLYLYKNFNLNVINIKIFNFQIIIRLIKILLLIFKKIILKIIFFQKKDVLTINKIDKNKKIIYFPHKGIFAGQLIYDYYYSKINTSPFYPSNIQHIEFDKKTNYKNNKKKLENYLNIKNIAYDNIYNINIIHTFKIFSQSIKLFFFLIKLKFSFQNILSLLIIYYEYKKFYYFLKRYSNFSLALIGYDILFSKSLSLALESHDIKTICLQDRVRNAYIYQHSYFADYQLTISKKIGNLLLDKSYNKLVKNSIPVGLVRTDFFDNKKSSIIKQSNIYNIIVFDYDVMGLDKFDSKSEPVLNYLNILLIKNKIYKLSKKFKNVNFIFRAKEIEWTKNIFFKDFFNKIKNQKNIIIDNNFKESKRSYDLSLSSDIIISVPSNIAEECIANGLKTIVMDYGINYHNSDSNIYEHSKNMYVHNFEHLKQTIEAMLASINEKNLYKDLEYSELFGIVDGEVRKRINSALELIYQKIENQKDSKNRT